MNPAANRRGERPKERAEPNRATSRTPLHPNALHRSSKRRTTGRRRRPEPGPSGPRKEIAMNRSIQRLTAFAVAAILVLAAVPSFAADAPAAAPSGVVNVNSATVEQLDLLPGVGPAVAGRILEHREKNGAFKTAEDLMLIKGI